MTVNIAGMCRYPRCPALQLSAHSAQLTRPGPRPGCCVPLNAWCASAAVLQLRAAILLLYCCYCRGSRGYIIMSSTEIGQQSPMVILNVSVPKQVTKKFVFCLFVIEKLLNTPYFGKGLTGKRCTS